MGTRDFKTCPHFQAGAQPAAGSESAVETPDDGSGLRLPWTGRGLGLADMTLASSRGPACLVGLIGPFNSGKTGLLTSIFAHFATTGVVASYSFAGSFTLLGWSQLKDHTTWPSPNGGMFPPHTPDTGQRTPSLLHLAFRRGGETVRDLLFTDAPGEWFTRWVSNEAAENSAGARWIADNATHFVFIVDREGLAGPEVGRIRNTTLALARRLSENLRGRPVIAVWTKSDGQCDEEVEAPVRARLNELFGEHPTLNLHVQDPACVNLLEVLLQQAPKTELPHEIAAPASAFLAFRGASS
jgi:hypothetical protein